MTSEERGLVLKKAIQPSEAILILPARLLLNVHTLDELLSKELLPSASAPSNPFHWRESQQDDSNDDANEVKLPLTSVQSLTLALAQWNAAQQRPHPKASRLDDMLASFPEDYDSFPLTWKILSQSSNDVEEEVARAHRSLLDALPPHVAHLCDKVLHRFKRDCQAIRLVEDRCSHLLFQQSNKLDIKDLLWAWCSVNSRCVYKPLGLKPHQDNFTLAPLLDMANHTVDSSLECKVKWTSTSALQLSAPAKSHQPQGLSVGQEVMITYGPHSNGTLLSEYGFTVPFSSSNSSGWHGNPFSEINVDDVIQAEFEKQGDSGKQKEFLLEQHGYYRNYTIHPFPLPAHPSFRLVIALRLLLLPLDTTAGRQINGQKKQKINDVDLQIKTWEEMLMGHRDIVSTENEAAVQAALLQICKVIETQSKDKKAACLDVLSHLNVTQTKKIQAKSNLVINLLNEELKISLMMQSAISNGLTDW